MARFVISTGIAPSEYKALTLREVTALAEEHNRQAHEAKRRSR